MEWGSSWWGVSIHAGIIRECSAIGAKQLELKTPRSMKISASMCSFSLKLSVLTNNSLVTCGDCFISAPLLLGSFAMNSTWSLSQLGKLDTISDLTAGNFGFQVILQTWVFCSFHSHQHQLRAWLLLYFWSNITTTIIMMKITPLYLCPKVLREKKKILHFASLFFSLHKVLMINS